jgi:hypothetical protein
MAISSLLLRSAQRTSAGLMLSEDFGKNAQRQTFCARFDLPHKDSRGTIASVDALCPLMRDLELLREHVVRGQSAGQKQ